MKRPLFWASLCTIAGILCAFSEIHVLTITAVVLSLIAGGCILILRPVPLIAIALPAGALLGVTVCSTFLRNESRCTEALFAAQSVSCVVTEVKDTSFIAVPTDSSFRNRRILVYEKENFPAIGDLVTVYGPFGEFAVAQNEGEWDAATYYRSNGYLGTAASWAPDGTRKNTLRYRIARFRKKVSERIDLLYPKETASMVKAVLYCDKSDLDSSLTMRYRRLGIAHILAVSGLHVSVFGGFLTAFFLQFLRRGRAEAAASIVLLAYGVLTGFPVSCARAVFTAMLSSMGRIFGRTPDRLTQTMFCAAVFLLCKPVLLLQQGFLLSFYCAFVLLRLSTDRDFRTMLQNGIRLSLYLLPLQAYFFYTVSLFSPFLNALILPFISLLLPAAAIAVAMSVPFLKLGRFLCGFSHYGFTLIDVTGKLLCKLAFSVITCGRPYIWNLLAYTFIVLCIIFLRKKNMCKAMILSALASICFLPIRSGEMRICNLSVGQGDCCVIIKGSTCVVIDCGAQGKTGVGERILVPFLNYHGFERPGLVILSHTDEDHVNGLTELLQEEWSDVTVVLPVTEKEAACREHENSAEDSVYGQDVNSTNESLYGDIIGNPERLRYMAKGDTLNVSCGLLYGKLMIEALSPDPNHIYLSSDNSPDKNDNSLVAVVSDGQYNTLFTGDCGTDPLSGITAAYPKLIGSCDYLKVPHHGSVHSAEEAFYALLHPAAAVVSVGNNSYGHPSDVILEMIRTTGAEAYVTKTAGQVTVTFTSKGITVRTFLQNTD